MIDGVRVREPDFFSDNRGDYWTTWKAGDFDLKFNHDKVSTSNKNVLRGIHGDTKSHKLVTCLHGEIYFVLVDNRKSSHTFMTWDSMILNEKNKKQVLIPPGVGNGFFVLSNRCVFHYKWSYKGNYPDVNDQFTIKWNDPTLDIEWPMDNPILSRRDK